MAMNLLKLMLNTILIFHLAVFVSVTMAMADGKYKIFYNDILHDWQIIPIEIEYFLKSISLKMS